jgi:hypothetical protein
MDFSLPYNPPILVRTIVGSGSGHGEVAKRHHVFLCTSGLSKTFDFVPFPS